MKKFKSIYQIEVEWVNDRNRPFLTSQIIRDKLFVPLQELWLVYALTDARIKDLSIVSVMQRTNIKGKREGTMAKEKKFERR